MYSAILQSYAYKLQRERKRERPYSTNCIRFEMICELSLGINASPNSNRNNSLDNKLQSIYSTRLYILRCFNHPLTFSCEKYDYTTNNRSDKFTIHTIIMYTVTQPMRCPSHKIAYICQHSPETIWMHIE